MPWVDGAKDDNPPSAYYRGCLGLLWSDMHRLPSGDMGKEQMV